MSPGAPTPTEAFWAAVSDTDQRAVAAVMDNLITTGHDLTFERLARLLAAVDDRLLLTLGAAEHSRPHVVISAGGDRAAFDAVFRLVAAAPAEVTDRFEVLALRPRHPDPASLVLRVGSTSLAALDVRWTGIPRRREPTVVDVTLYVPGWIETLPATSGGNQARAEACFVILDHAVGEYGVETQVGAIEFRSREHAPDDSEPLTSFPDCLDRISAR